MMWASSPRLSFPSDPPDELSSYRRGGGMSLSDSMEDDESAGGMRGVMSLKDSSDSDSLPCPAQTGLTRFQRQGCIRRVPPSG
eukprot:CAMPEP_0113585612 /NCGR_PEP_ID=MMETSP0015_2-20120614/33799_1 /TAXON_ID=2838 /ORGANISM="Odontella" /LENGTH=82 /DNA_ID=CAMNT_0000490879 /DNA_START=163 /DNA_END=411 /DNA_ORIENTATION=- /assembly_acc=CAM_ASM_000160